MRILLTGGSGFIGRNLREALANEHDVVAPSHRELDVLDEAAVDHALRQRPFDAIVHAAVQGGSEVLPQTLRGFWNIARNAGRVGRIFYFGSGAEYGKQRDLRKACEDQIGEVVPRDDYGFAKLWCNGYARRSRNIVNLRLFGVYGPYEGYLFRFISNSLVKAMLGFELVIRQDVVFDYLFVGDLMKVFKKLLGCESEFRDVNITPTDPISLRRIVEIISGLTGLPTNATFLNEGLNYEYTGDNSRLLSLAPGFRFTPYEEGIRLLHDFYQARRSTLDAAALARDDFLARVHSRFQARASMHQDREETS